MFSMREGPSVHRESWIERGARRFHRWSRGCKGKPRTWSMVEPPVPRMGTPLEGLLITISVSWVTICLQNVPLRDFGCFERPAAKAERWAWSRAVA